MSGFEAAGIVLGAWPLVVNMITLYHSGRNGHEWELLLDEFKTEEVIYVDTIRSLLQANVSESVLLQLSNREKPNHYLWKDPDLHRSLEKRMGKTHFPIVLTILQNMDVLLKVVHDKLKNLEIAPDASHAKFRSGFRHIRVNLPNGSIKDSLLKLYKYNSQLQRIIVSHGSTDNSTPAQWKQPASSTKLPPETLKRITAQANALHDAIDDGYNCSCRQPHEANLSTHSPDDLELAQPFELLFPVDEGTATQITHDETVASPISTLGVTESPELESSSFYTSRRWSNSPDPLLSPFTCPSTLPPASPYRSISLSQTKGPEDGGLINDLCHFIRKLGEDTPLAAPATCLGVLGLKKQRYTVKVTSLDSDSAHSPSFVCLDDFLAPSHKWEANRKKRMDLALNLSLAILQFYSTPWINMWWTWKDFCMLKGDKSQVFVTKRFYSTNTLALKPQDQIHSASSSHFWDCVGEPVLTRLGFALVELALGQRLSELREDASAAIDDEDKLDMMDLCTAKELVNEGRIEGEAGNTYNLAVSACLNHQILSDSGMRALNSEHPDFKHDMAQFVVAPIMGLWDSSWGQVGGG